MVDTEKLSNTNELVAVDTLVTLTLLPPLVLGKYVVGLIAYVQVGILIWIVDLEANPEGLVEAYTDLSSPESILTG